MNTKKTMPELERLTKEEFAMAKKNSVILVLDEVRSMHNVGSVFRTADSFLIEGIYLCGLTPQPPHRDIQKTALGATETVTWKYFSQTLIAVEELKNEGYIILAVEQVHGSQFLNKIEFDFSKKYAFIFGHEVNGVSEEVIALCDGVIEIPQVGSKHSLNISVSVGIVVWEFVKQNI